MSGDDVGLNRELADSLGIAFPLFSDPQGELLQQLLAPMPPVFPETAPSETKVATYLLDPNQRVLEVLRSPPAAEHAAKALDLIAQWAVPDGPRHLLHDSAPVLCLPDVFDQELCRALIEAWEKEHQEGGVSDGSKNLVDYGKKRNLEHVVMDTDLSRLVQRTMARRIGPELVKVFNYTAPYRFEGLTVLSYRDDRQDFFGTHRDNLRQTQPAPLRHIPQPERGLRGRRAQVPRIRPPHLSPQGGDAVVFSCSLLHEALPVTKGQRWVLTTFMCDPDPDPAKAGQARAPMKA